MWRRASKWQTHLREIALAVTDQQTGLAAAAIADYDNLLRIGGCLGHVCRCGLAAAGRTEAGADGALTRAGALLASRLLVVTPVV